MRIYRLFAMTCILAGCTSIPSEMRLIHRTGATQPEIQAALDQCRIAAINLVPQSNRSTYSPGIHTTGTTYCSTIGSSTTCNTSGGLNIPGRVETVDENEGLRDRTIERCLRSNGYTVVVKPVCKTEGERKVALQQSQKQPPLAEIKCMSGVALQE